MRVPLEPGPLGRLTARVSDFVCEAGGWQHLFDTCPIGQRKPLSGHATVQAPDKHIGLKGSLWLAGSAAVTDQLNQLVCAAAGSALDAMANVARCTHISVVNVVIIGCRSAHPARDTPEHVDHAGTPYSELLVPVSVPNGSAPPGLKLLDEGGSVTTVHHEVGSAMWLRDVPHIVEERQYSDDDILVIVAATVAECQGLGPPAQLMYVKQYNPALLGVFTLWGEQQQDGGQEQEQGGRLRRSKRRKQW